MKTENIDIKLVLIEWEDSIRPDPEWRYVSDIETNKIVKCESVGFLIHDGENVKSLAPNIGRIDDTDDTQVSGVIQIPTCSVKKITRLKPY